MYTSRICPTSGSGPKEVYLFEAPSRAAVQRKQPVLGWAGQQVSPHREFYQSFTILSSATAVKYEICHRCLLTYRETVTLPWRNVLLTSVSNSGCRGDPSQRHLGMATTSLSRNLPLSKNRGRGIGQGREVKAALGSKEQPPA